MLLLSKVSNRESTKGGVIYTERSRLRPSLTLMMDQNAFYIEVYRKTQTDYQDGLEL